MSADEGMFGPGTDLIIKLLGIVIMMVAIQQKRHGDSVIYVQEHQKKVIKEVGRSFRSIVREDSVKIDSVKKEIVYRISTNNISQTNDTISVKNDAIIQRFFFGANILFKPNQHILSEEGKNVFKVFGKVLKDSINFIKEIQIQGHADNSTPDKLKYYSNVELAFARANIVYHVLKDEIGINPYEHLISIVSYGEFKPVERKDELEWTERKNNQANDGYKKNFNRRIEIVLIYKEKR